MRRTIWTTFGTALVLVNLIAEIGGYYTGISVHVFLRIAIILGVTAGAAIFQGAFILVNQMDQERPLSGRVRDTLGPDRLPATPQSAQGGNDQQGLHRKPAQGRSQPPL